MLMPIGTYVRQGQQLLRQFHADPKVAYGLRLFAWGLAGFLCSAASLGNTPLPLVMGLLCAGIGGWDAVSVAMGGMVGYPIFWGTAGMPGIIWTLTGILLCLTLGERSLIRSMPLLLPMLAGLGVAFTGLMLRFWGGAPTPPVLYLLQIGIAAGAARVFTVALNHRWPITDWLTCGFITLALAQVPLLPGISLGMVAGGALAVWAPFPAVALSGLALDLSQTAPAPMTALLCLCFFLRLIPHLPKWAIHAAPGAVYLLAAPLCGSGEMLPAIALAVGGVLGLFLPPQTPISHRQGETGVAQVRLEMAAGVLAQYRQLLLEHREYPIDEEALVYRAAQRACLTCSCRKSCRDQERATQLPVNLLHRPLVGISDIPLTCGKPSRLLQELRRSQEQLRAIRADRDRQREYRTALSQQYLFLTQYLQTLSQDLPRRAKTARPVFDVDVAGYTAGLRDANGDKCIRFAGPGCQYFVLLCDGMGTGMGAEEESRVACDMLQRLLSAGFPPDHALQSLNDLLALRGKAGAVTVDLACIDLQTGKVKLYKWGAAASILLSPLGAEKIGTAGPPPGLMVSSPHATVNKLSLGRGQTLILVSDGIDGEAVMSRAKDLSGGTTGETASRVMEYGRGNGQDDASAAVIRLRHRLSST